MAIIDVNILTLGLLFPISNTSLFSIVLSIALEDQSTAIDKVSISSIHHYEGICAYYFSKVCEQ